MLSKAELDSRTKQYLEIQAQYNKTGDKELLWTGLRPLLIDMIRHCAMKKSQHHYIPDFDWKVENQVERVIERYYKHQGYNKQYPMTLAFWEAVHLLYSSSYEKLDSDISVDDLYEVEERPSQDEEDIKLVDVGGNRIFMNYETNEFYFVKEGEKVEEVVKTLEENGWKKV